MILRILSLTILILILIWIKLWLVAFIVIAGFIYLKKQNRFRKIKQLFLQQKPFVKYILEWVFIILVSALFVLFIKTYVFDIFRLPSNSMANTVKNGDLILINKLRMGPRVNPNNANRYKRAWGHSKPQTNDLIVFNFPEGDTTLINNPQQSYYALKRRFKGSKSISESEIWTNKTFQKVNRRPRYIKRLIGLPGDTVEIVNGIAYVNNIPSKQPDEAILKFSSINTNPDSILNLENIKPYNQYYFKQQKIYELESEVIAKSSLLKNNFNRFIIPKNLPDPNIFPYDLYWNTDNLGPLVIPKKGISVNINPENINIYKRIIEIYEENQLKIIDNKIIINDKITDKYTFKLNYYWVLGDNRPHSYDSRYWGFLPENHIIGITNNHIHLN